MTTREKEIKDAEQKAMAEVRRWKRNASKKWLSLSPAEFEEYFRKQGEESRAKGYNVVSSLK